MNFETYDNTFMLRIEDAEKSRNYDLSADSEEEMHEWIGVLQNVLGVNLDCEFKGLMRKSNTTVN